jgi:hypothetical protein
MTSTRDSNLRSELAPAQRPSRIPGAPQGNKPLASIVGSRQLHQCSGKENHTAGNQSHQQCGDAIRSAKAMTASQLNIGGSSLLMPTESGGTFRSGSCLNSQGVSTVSKQKLPTANGRLPETTGLSPRVFDELFTAIKVDRQKTVWRTTLVQHASTNSA